MIITAIIGSAHLVATDAHRSPHEILSVERNTLSSVTISIRADSESKEEADLSQPGTDQTLYSDIFIFTVRAHIWL